MYKIPDTLDQFFEESGLGSTRKALGNFLYGYNHGLIHPGIPLNKNTYGWTFFTRPQLNLRSTNIRNVRQFYPLLTTNPLSIQRYVRLMLDPRLQRELYFKNRKVNFYSREVLTSPLVDPNTPFIPILTNAIQSISGWPDEALPTYTTTQGVRREQAGLVDGTYEILNSYDLNVTFNNYINDPVFMLFQIWTRYESLVFENMVQPYWDQIVRNSIDYNTRIYRITTDSTWENINYIGACGAGFPLATPTGKIYDFSKDKPYNFQTKEINIRFRCFGAIYNDDILIKEFNLVNAIFNPEYRAYLQGSDTMEPIPKELRSILNFRGYPYIDPNSYKLLWLIPKSSPEYRKITEEYSKMSDSQLENVSKQLRDAYSSYDTQNELSNNQYKNINTQIPYNNSPDTDTTI